MSEVSSEGSAALEAPSRWWNLPAMALAPTDPTLHYGALPPIALRPVALREVYRTEEILATENEREMLMRAPTHVHPAHAALCC